MTTPSVGVTGSQHGFIEKCWREADPDGMGQPWGSGGNKSSGATTLDGATPPAPLLPQPARGHKSTANPAANPLLPRDPTGNTASFHASEERGPALDPSNLPPEWHFEWDERAAIMEFEGRMPRERAEALALADILKRMSAQEGASR